MAKVNLQDIDKNLIRAKKGPSASPVTTFCLGLKPDEAYSADEIAKKVSLSLDMVLRKLKQDNCRIYLPKADGSGHEPYGAHPDTAAKYLK